MSDQIMSFLNKFQWGFEQVDENILLSNITLENGTTYPFLICAKDDICSLSSSVSIQPALLRDNTDFLLLLLRMNDSWPFLKIGLNENQNLLQISVDVFMAGLTYDSFIQYFELFTDGIVVFRENIKEFGIPIDSEGNENP